MEYLFVLQAVQDLAWQWSNDGFASELPCAQNRGKETLLSRVARKVLCPTDFQRLQAGISNH